MRLEIPAEVLRALDNVMSENWRERIVPEIRFDTEEGATERSYNFTITWPIFGFRNVATYTEDKPFEEWE